MTTPPEENGDQRPLPNTLAQPGDGAAAYDPRPVRRIWFFSILGWMGLAGWFVSKGEWYSLLGLTCTALLTMMNFLWLEGVLVRLLQPAPQAGSLLLALRTLTRFALFAAALSIAIFVVRFNALSVLLGLSVLVIGVMGEALYSIARPKKAMGE